MATILATLLMGTVPYAGPVQDTVDLIEVNHYYDYDTALLIFDQVILYRWCPYEARYEVVAWRLLKQESQRPIRDWERGGYVATWHDGDILRQVRSVAYRETYTQYDPELAAREHLPKDRRVQLTAPRNLERYHELPLPYTTERDP